MFAFDASDIDTVDYGDFVTESSTDPPAVPPAAPTNRLLTTNPPWTGWCP